jgi:hypothetical protein
MRLQLPVQPVSGDDDGVAGGDRRDIVAAGL